MQRRVLIAIVVIAFLGFLDAAYLFLTSYYGESPVCNFTSGCDVVAASSYSKVAGIPLSLIGAFFYLVTIGFALWARASKDTETRHWVLGIAAVGALSSIYFLFLQAFVIKAWCEYCLFSAFATFVILALAIYFWKKSKQLSSGTVVQ